VSTLTLVLTAVGSVLLLLFLVVKARMHADFGWMILIGLCAAIPGMIIAGPL
jgi:H+/gluconate symporter-like permease